MAAVAAGVVIAGEPGGVDSGIVPATGWAGGATFVAGMGGYGVTGGGVSRPMRSPKSPSAFLPLLLEAATGRFTSVVAASGAGARAAGLAAGVTLRGAGAGGHGRGRAGNGHPGRRGPAARSDGLGHQVGHLRLPAREQHRLGEAVRRVLAGGRARGRARPREPPARPPPRGTAATSGDGGCELLSSAFRTTRSTSGVSAASGRRWLGASGGLETCSSSTVSGVPWNGGSPVSR